MDINDVSVSYQPSVDIQMNQFREEYRQNRKKTILQIGFVGAFIVLLLISITTLIYIVAHKQQTKSLCIIDFNVSTSTSTSITSTFQQLLTTTTTYKIDSNTLFVLNPCIERNIEYYKWGMPIQNYSLYPIDASLIILNSLISLNVTMYPSNIDCTWSLDVYPMDGRSIPLSGRPTDSVFGLYDQDQNSTVEQLNISTLDNWSNGTGKFLIGITGAWYGDPDIGCQGYGIIYICFNNPSDI